MATQIHGREQIQPATITEDRLAFSVSGLAYYEQAGTPEEPVMLGSVWLDTDEAPPAWVASVPLVTSLPASPLDGQEVYFLADSASGAMWHLRYRAGSPNANKWEYLGGSNLFAEVVADGGLTGTGAFGDGGSVIGPSLTVPLPGLYEFEMSFGWLFGNQAGWDFWMGLKIGAAAAEIHTQFRIAAANLFETAGFKVRRSAVGGDLVKAQYGANGGGWSYHDRRLFARPVRVSTAGGGGA